MRLELKANTKPLENTMAFLGRFEELVAEAGEETARELTPALLAQLQKQPPERTENSPKIQWTSEWQQYVYFASDGFGAGIPYKRTGGLAAAWHVITERTSTGFRMVVENPKKAARFVYGSLAKDVAKASRFQQQFHKTTGWLTASPIVNEWMDTAQVMFRVKLGEKIVALGVTVKRRAITPRLKRRG